MRRAIGIGMWALLLVAGPGALAQEPAAGTAQAAAVQRQPGKRLRLELKETRERDGSPTSTRASALLLHADAGPARLFVGAQLVITVSEREATTNIFKNAGMTLEARLAAQPDGRYLASVRFEESRRRRMPEPVDAPVAGRNPILQVVKGESRLSLREGETLPLATAVDPVTGEVVRLELGLAATAAAGAARTASPGVPVRARLVLVRRQGSTMLVRRPYTLVLHPGGDEGAEVFSGSMLPVQVRMNNQITVALKDVGAGLKLKAHSTEDGHRLEVQFSDGVLSPGEDGPQVRVFESESQLLVQEGETLTLASAVDPVTGEVVEAELTLEAVR